MRPELVFAKDATVTTAAKGGLPVSQTVEVTTTDGQSASFDATDDAPWLGVGPASGQAPQRLTLRIDPRGLGGGVHNATVTITAPGYAPAKHRIKLNVTESTI